MNVSHKVSHKIYIGNSKSLKLASRDSGRQTLANQYVGEAKLYQTTVRSSSIETLRTMQDYLEKIQKLPPEQALTDSINSLRRIGVIDKDGNVREQIVTRW